jgi:hypothetical protein
MCGITVVVRMWGDMLMESPDTSAMVSFYSVL